MNSRFPFRLLAGVSLLAAFGLSSCLTPPLSRVESPDVRLEALLLDLRSVRGGAFDSREGPYDPGHQADREGRIVRAIQALALEHPRHVPVLVASASLDYERGDSLGAQKYLDQALSIDPSHVPATLLRVRIAAEEGNLPYARRRLEEQLELAPDDARLRETYGGVLYLLGDHELALAELDLAERLRTDDGPAWRTTYHRGLIAEAQGRHEEALELYDRSRRQNPEFQPSQRRWRWLNERLTAPTEGD